MDRQTAEGDRGAPTEGLLPEQRQVDAWRTDGQTGGQTAEGDQGAPTEGLLPEQRQVDAWRTDGQTGGQTDSRGRSGSANRRPAPRAVAGRRLEDRQTAEGDRGAPTEGLLPKQREVDAWRTDGQTGGQTAEGDQGAPTEGLLPEQRQVDAWRTDGQTGGQADSRGRSGSANRRPAPRAAAGRRLEDRRTTDRQTADGDRGAPTEGLLPEQRQVDTWRTDGQTGGQTDSRGRSGSANRPAPRAAAGRRLEDRRIDGWTDRQPREIRERQQKACSQSSGR